LAAAAVPATSASAATIAAGGQHTCAVLTDGGVRCWGANEHGQLGNGTKTRSTTPVPAIGITDAIAVAAGSFHTCALRATGRVSCWGNNVLGQLGDGTSNDAPVPVAITGLTDATQVAAGGSGSCALRMGGSVVCWGADSGTDTSSGVGAPHSVTPYQLAGVTNATGVLISNGATCTAAATGTACSTYSIDNGDGSKGASPTALPIPVTSDVVAISNSVWGHDCVARSDGRVSCRGFNGQGDLGRGMIGGARQPDFADVQGVTDAITVAATSFGGCVLNQVGDVRCWGGSIHGELGNGSMTASPTPVAVAGATGAVQLTADGGFHACVADRAGSVKCWGGNYDGQLGNGSLTDSTVPVTVPGVKVATALAVNYPEAKLPGGGSPTDLGTKFGLRVGRVARSAATTRAKARLADELVAFSRFALPLRRGHSCPARVTVRVAGSARTGKPVTGRFTTAADGNRVCTLSAVVQLAGGLKTAKSVTYTLSGKHLTATSKRLKAS
jgi:alpha-tubulin suppressor-like RCC1 family protein